MVCCCSWKLCLFPLKLPYPPVLLLPYIDLLFDLLLLWEEFELGFEEFVLLLEFVVVLVLVLW